MSWPIEGSVTDAKPHQCHWRKHGKWEEHDKIAIGVSGGHDWKTMEASVAYLDSWDGCHLRIFSKVTKEDAKSGSFSEFISVRLSVVYMSRGVGHTPNIFVMVYHNAVTLLPWYKMDSLENADNWYAPKLGFRRACVIHYAAWHSMLNSCLLSRIHLQCLTGLCRMVIHFTELIRHLYQCMMLLKVVGL